MIRKMLVFISCVIACMLVYFAYDAYDQKNVITLGTYQDYIQEITGQKMLPTLFEFSNKEMIDESLQSLMNLAKTHDATLVSVTSKTNGLRETYTYGIYSSNEGILSHIKYDGQEAIDFENMDTPQYISTDQSDQNRIGTILSLSNRYFKNKVYNLATFITAKDTFAENQNGMIYIYADDTDAFLADLAATIHDREHFPQSISYTNIDGYTSAQLDKIQAITTEHILPLLISCATIFTILLIVYITKMKKEIMIQRMNGISVASFIHLKLGKLCIIICCAFTLSTVGSFFLFSHKIDSLTIDLWYQIILYPFYFIALLFLVLLLLYIYINKTSNLKFLRISSGTHYAVQINLSMKIMLIVLLFPTLLTTGLSAISSIGDYNALSNHKNEILDIIRMDKMNITYSNKQKLFEYYQNNDGRYVDFDNYANNQYSELIKYVPEEHVEEEIISYPMIYANANYLSAYTIKDMDGQILDINTIKEDTLLIPPDYKDEDLRKACYSSECNRIYIQNPGRFVNYKLENQVYTLQNPVIHVVTKLSDDANIFHMYLPILQDKSISTYDKEIKELVSGTVTLRENGVYIEYILSDIKESIYDFLSILGLYLIIFTAFIYQYVYLNLSEKLPELSIQYMLGESRLMRYKEILYISIIGYFIPCSIAIVIQKLPIVPVIFSTLFFIIIEFLMEYSMLMKAEKKNVASVLKGERNI